MIVIRKVRAIIQFNVEHYLKTHASYITADSVVPSEPINVVLTYDSTDNTYFLDFQSNNINITYLDEDGIGVWNNLEGLKPNFEVLMVKPLEEDNSEV